MFLAIPAPDPTVEISVASRGYSKGIAQTDGPQIVAKGSLRVGDLRFAAQWKNITSTVADGELWLSAGVSPKLGTVQLEAGVTYKLQTGARSRGRSNSRSIEFNGAARRKFGPVIARVNIAFSPDDLGAARRSMYVEGAVAVQLGKGWTAGAALGHRERERAPSYTSFNAGVTKSIGSLQLDLRFFDTNRSGIGDAYHARFVASAKLGF